jgi:hypothetical protein
VRRCRCLAHRALGDEILSFTERSGTPQWASGFQRPLRRSTFFMIQPSNNVFKILPIAISFFRLPWAVNLEQAVQVPLCTSS